MARTTATSHHASAQWLSRLERNGAPIYLALVNALEAAIRDGELTAGDQLPPQRTVADKLGIDFTTVTRAYTAARARGLVEAVTGRGTFVRAKATDEEAGLVDLSMNLPPPPEGVSLAGLLKDTTRAILDRTDAATLMAYHPGAGTLGQKSAGCAWLAPCLGPVKPDRVLVCGGAQTALVAVLAALTRPRDAIVVEPLTYPGLIAIARQLGLRLLACPVDDEGVAPEALARLCADQRPAAIYLIPALQNPTASTMGIARRHEVAAILERHQTWLIEDDPYSLLFDTPVPAIASLAPERTIYIATLSKCLSPGLRTAFMVTPSGPVGERVAASLRATSLMTAPLMAAIVTSWIRDGAADALLAGVRREARARRQIAADILPRATGAAESIHVWLDLPAKRNTGQLHAIAQKRGLSLVTAEAFAANGDHRNGVRISLGGPAKRATLSDALQTVAALVADAASPRMVV